jgi:hypothetical protein
LFVLKLVPTITYSVVSLSVSIGLKQTMMISLDMVLRFSYWFLRADFDAMARSSIAHSLRFFLIYLID